MRFIDKDNLLKDLKKFRYFLDENDEPTVYASEEIISAITRYIESYQEDECIKCGADYWLKYYDIYTREWLPDKEDNDAEINEPIYSFIVVRKPIQEIKNIDENKETVEENISTEED